MIKRFSSVSLLNLVFFTLLGFFFFGPAKAGKTHVELHLSNEWAWVIEGVIDEHLFSQFDLAAQESTPPKYLLVNSSGGSVVLAHKIAQFVKTHAITVIVGQECSSACTLLMFAAPKRLISAKTIVKLHGAKSQSDLVSFEQAQELFRAAYRDFGVTEAFSERIMAIPFDEPLTLAAEELIELNIATQLTGIGPALSTASSHSPTFNKPLATLDTDLAQKIDSLKKYRPHAHRELLREIEQISALDPFDPNIGTAIYQAYFKEAKKALLLSGKSDVLAYWQVLSKQTQFLVTKGKDPLCQSMLLGSNRASIGLSSDLLQAEIDLYERALQSTSDQAVPTRLLNNTQVTESLNDIRDKVMGIAVKTQGIFGCEHAAAFSNAIGTLESNHRAEVVSYLLYGGLHP